MNPSQRKYRKKQKGALEGPFLLQHPIPASGFKLLRPAGLELLRR